MMVPSNWALDSLSKRPVKVYVPGMRLMGIASLSEGSETANIDLDNGPRYIQGAIMPKPHWRPLLDSEIKILQGIRPIGIHRTVGVARIFSSDFAEYCRQNIDALKETFESDTKIWQHPVLSKVLKMTQRVCSIGGPIIYNSVASHKGALALVTFDRRRDVRLGLHVDNWEHTGLDDADFVLNRISINIGPGTRYFLFVNLRVGEMLKILKEHHNLEPQTKAELTREFLERYPHYPVIRVRLQPGEAYIAPTENLIHEGSSIDAPHSGYHITFRGRFMMLEPELLGMPIVMQASD